MNIRKIFIPLSGAISLICILIAGIFFFGGILDGFYYHDIHKKMHSIATTISNDKFTTGAYAHNSKIKSWSEQLDLFPPLYIAAPSENRTIDDPDKIKIPTDSFALAYWDGDDYELYYPWNNIFTTSIPKHVGTALLISIFFVTVAFVFHKARLHSKIQANKTLQLTPSRDASAITTVHPFHSHTI